MAECLRGRLRNLLMVILFSVVCSGCVHRGAVTDEEKEADLEKLCAHYALDWRFDEVSQVVTLIKGDSRAKGVVGSNVFVLNGSKVVLSKPVRKNKNSFIVPGDFKQKIIDQLLQTSVFSSRSFKEIVIDPGHGGKDPGAIGRFGSEEKNIVLDIATRLKRNLEKSGIKIVMTRTKDEFVSLEKRTEIASQSKAGLFVSIHANASRAKSVRGMEIYYLRELDLSEHNEEQSLKNKAVVFRRYSMERRSTDLENILSDMLYSYKRYESQQLASFMSQRTAGTLNVLNRGSKQAGFFVLRNTLVPAILVEVGFLSNEREEALLNTSAFRQRIADGLSKSILEYAND